MATRSHPWHGHNLDLDAYLDRIGHTGARTADVETLIAVHRAHVATIPFENVDIIIGRGLDLDLAAIEDKMVHRARGGYCHEHGLLLAAALESLGFQVERTLAYIGDLPRSHLAVRVRIGDTDWLADTGFGSGLLEPVPLVAAEGIRQGEWTFRVRRAGRAWRLEEQRADGWEKHYRVTDEPTSRLDIERANYIAATHPGSPFVRRLVVIRKDDRRIRQLTGRDYNMILPGATTSPRPVPDAEIGQTLAELGLPLPPQELAALIRALPSR